MIGVNNKIIIVLQPTQTTVLTHFGCRCVPDICGKIHDKQHKKTNKHFLKVSQPPPVSLIFIIYISRLMYLDTFLFSELVTIHCGISSSVKGDCQTEVQFWIALHPVYNTQQQLKPTYTRLIRVNAQDHLSDSSLIHLSCCQKYAEVR